MALVAGRYELGTTRGRIVLHTYREGVAAQAGHDLTLEVGTWSGELTVGQGGVPADLLVRMAMNSLTVREGSGGLRSLTDRDRRDIETTARKVLRTDRHPEATFAATRFEPAADGDGDGTISGNLTLAGASRPLRLQVTSAGPDRYQASTSVVQTEFGIRPYRGMLGALRLRDAVDVDADVDLSQAPAERARP
jgi:hypothetical protein